MIEFVFLDLDDTILDFRMAESVAIGKTLGELGIEPTPEVKALYSTVNLGCWKELERGELTREALKVTRFVRFFQALGVAADPEQTAERYVNYLSQGHWFLPGAEEAVWRLKEKYRLFLASNGNAAVQQGRMTSAGLYPCFEQCFVSEELGAYKPSAEFFRRAFERIQGFDPSRAVMVGDSLTSDIQGGINAGIRTVWVDPQNRAEPRIRPDHTIPSIARLEELLDSL